MSSGLWASISAHQSQIVNGLFRHILIVAISVIVGALIAIPLGVWLSRRPRVAEPIISVVGFLQTIPSLALLALILPLFGIGLIPAVIALAVYSLLPILRNTYAGLHNIPEELVDAARAMGMNPKQVLTQVEMPLAMPIVIAGVRLSTVYLVSWAVLAGLIGAGGLGVLIFEGLSTYSFGLILAGAVPAALLAIVAGFLFSWLESTLTPEGIRLRNQHEGEDVA